MPKPDDAKTGSALRSWWLIGLVLLIVAVYAFLTLRSSQSSDTRKVLLGGFAYTMQVADEPVEHQRGLSGAEPLGEREGMLFVYDQPESLCFWMKDMRYALDMIWLDQEKRIVHIEREVAPETFPSSFCSPEQAQYVIEVANGAADDLKLSLGDQVDF